MSRSARSSVLWTLTLLLSLTASAQTKLLRFAPDGSWITESECVAPDIEVDNDPPAVIAGRDPQLERAIEEVMKRIEAEPRRLPTRPPDPVKTK